MPRYVALLRGVSPTNATMPRLRAAFEAAGFGNVRTVRSSGNVVFDARRAAETTLARRAEAAMAVHCRRPFLTIVRSASALDALIADDPFAAHRLAPGAKRIVTFLRDPPRVELELPFERDGARVLARRGLEVFAAYVPSSKGGAFMGVLEGAYGTAITTRTWDTVRMCARA